MWFVICNFDVINLVGKPTHSKCFLQVLEVLTHVNKRVKQQTSIPLPLFTLVAQFADPSATPLQRNFYLIYIDMAITRSSQAVRFLHIALIKFLTSDLVGSTQSHLSALAISPFSGPFASRSSVANFYSSMYTQ